MFKSILLRKKVTPEQELQMKQEMDRAVFALQARMERMLRQNGSITSEPLGQMPAIAA